MSGTLLVDLSQLSDQPSGVGLAGGTAVRATHPRATGH
jgi:hypothetical protein